MNYKFRLFLNRLKRKIRPYTKLKLNKKISYPFINSNSRVILIATSTLSKWHFSSFDALLGYSLKLKGYDVYILLCDEFLDACQECEYEYISPKEISNNQIKSKLCIDCFSKSANLYKNLGLKTIKYSDFYKFTKLDEQDKSIIRNNTDAGVLRYFAVGILKDQLYERQVKFKFLKSSIKTLRVIKNIKKTLNPEVTICHHGVYSPQGIISDFLYNANSRVVTWVSAYRDKTFLFSHERSYHYTLPEETDSEWNNFQLSKNDEKKLMDYLDSRKEGDNDWITFQKKTKDVKLTKRLNNFINKDDDITILLTNVFWDAQLHFKQNIFGNMLEWILFTIDFYKKNPKKKLIIRVHPAEINGSVPSRQKILDEILKNINFLPKNIFLIRPEDEISTYDLFSLTENFIVYSTKTAIELTSQGKKVIICGESWAKNKGFSIDPKNKNEYLEILDTINMSPSMNKEQLNLARKFEYYIFYKIIIKIDSVQKSNFLGPFFVRKDFDTKNDKGLKFVVDCIINNKPFSISSYN